MTVARTMAADAGIGVIENAPNKNIDEEVSRETTSAAPLCSKLFAPASLLTTRRILAALRSSVGERGGRRMRRMTNYAFRIECGRCNA